MQLAKIKRKNAPNGISANSEEQSVVHWCYYTTTTAITRIRSNMPVFKTCHLLPVESVWRGKIPSQSGGKLDFCYKATLLPHCRFLCQQGTISPVPLQLRHRIALCLESVPDTVKVIGGKQTLTATLTPFAILTVGYPQEQSRCSYGIMFPRKALTAPANRNGTSGC